MRISDWSSDVCLCPYDGALRRGFVPVAEIRSPGTSELADGSFQGLEAPWIARRGDHRTVLQLRLLYAARLYAVPAGHDRASGGPGLFWLGIGAGVCVRNPRAPAASQFR